MTPKAFLKFKSELLSWDGLIRRSAYLTELRTEDLPGGGFALVGSWPGGEYRHEYTPALVLGKTYGFPPNKQRPERPACHHRRDFIRNVLALRGV